MNARLYRGLCVLCVAGIAACTSGPEAKKPTGGGTTTPGGGTTTPGGGTTTPGGGTTTPGTPGAPSGRGRRGRVVNAECHGPSNLSITAREQLADRVCSTETTRGVRKSAKNTCANAYNVRGDAQIVGLLSAYSDEMMRMSQAAENEASDPMVRDLAHLSLAAHTRLHNQQTDSVGRIKIRPQTSSVSRSFGGGFHAEFGAITHGETFDRDFVARQVEGSHRALMMLDAVSSQAKSTDLHCDIESARVITETQLDQACWVWSTMGHVQTPGQTAGGRSRGPGGQLGQGRNIGQGRPIEGTPAGQAPSVGQGAPAGQAPSVGQGAPAGQAPSVGQGAPAGQGGNLAPPMEQTGQSGDCMTGVEDETETDADDAQL